MLAAWRVLLAAIMLLPSYVIARQRFGDTTLLAILNRSLLPGVILAAHFISWVIGARLSLGVNATIIVSLVPLALPVLLWGFFGESLRHREWIATGLALSGLALLAFDGVQLSTQYMMGDLVCFVSMILFALYLVMARRFKHLQSLWLYLVPVYAVAGVTALCLAPLFGPIVPTWTPVNMIMVLSLAGISTVIGHSALNYAMQHMRGQTVGIMTLAQFLFAGVIAYFLYDEVPGLLFYPACLLMCLGMLLIVLNERVTDN